MKTSRARSGTKPLHGTRPKSRNTKKQDPIPRKRSRLPYGAGDVHADQQIRSIGKVLHEMAPPKGALCQEASPASLKDYIPCGRPATRVVETTDRWAYVMCEACADHNVRNRGARLVVDGEQVELYEPANAKLWPKMGVEPKTHPGGQTKPEEAPSPAPPGASSDPIGDYPEKLLEYVVAGMAKFKGVIEERNRQMVRQDVSAPQIAQVYAAYYRSKNVIDDALKAFNDAFEKLKTEILPEVFERDNVGSFTIKGGFADGARVTTTQRLFCGIASGKQAEAFAHLRRPDVNLGDLIRETVNAGTLSSAAKELLEQGKELPEDLFNTHYKKSTSMTDVKK